MSQHPHFTIFFPGSSTTYHTAAAGFADFGTLRCWGRSTDHVWDWYCVYSRIQMRGDRLYINHEGMPGPDPKPAQGGQEWQTTRFEIEMTWCVTWYCCISTCSCTAKRMVWNLFLGHIAETGRGTETKHKLCALSATSVPAAPLFVSFIPLLCILSG